MQRLPLAGWILYLLRHVQGRTEAAGEARGAGEAAGEGAGGQGVAGPRIGQAHKIYSASMWHYYTHLSKLKASLPLYYINCQYNQSAVPAYQCFHIALYYLVAMNTTYSSELYSTKKNM